MNSKMFFFSWVESSRFQPVMYIHSFLILKNLSYIQSWFCPEVGSANIFYKGIK